MGIFDEEEKEKFDCVESSSAEKSQMLRLCLVSERCEYFILSVSEVRALQERLFSRRGKEKC